MIGIHDILDNFSNHLIRNIFKTVEDVMDFGKITVISESNSYQNQCNSPNILSECQSMTSTLP